MPLADSFLRAYLGTLEYSRQKDRDEKADAEREADAIYREETLRFQREKEAADVRHQADVLAQNLKMHQDTQARLEQAEKDRQLERREDNQRQTGIARANVYKSEELQGRTPGEAKAAALGFFPLEKGEADPYDAWIDKMIADGVFKPEPVKHTLPHLGTTGQRSVGPQGVAGERSTVLPASPEEGRAQYYNKPSPAFQLKQMVDTARAASTMLAANARVAAIKQNKDKQEADFAYKKARDERMDEFRRIDDKLAERRTAVSEGQLQVSKGNLGVSRDREKRIAEYQKIDAVSATKIKPLYELAYKAYEVDVKEGKKLEKERNEAKIQLGYAVNGLNAILKDAYGRPLTPNAEDTVQAYGAVNAWKERYDIAEAAYSAWMLDPERQQTEAEYKKIKTTYDTLTNRQMTNAAGKSTGPVGGSVPAPASGGGKKWKFVPGKGLVPK